ncbi:MAG: DUF2079 domain-containing protein [Deltaproteobacteria bacterium]|nr:DUF2079 domain-containing protein [Deltaproteobacteria bacterium]
MRRSDSAKKIFASPWAGLGAAAAWLCWPAVHDLTLGAMDTETLAGPLWLFAALFFAERRPIAFWIAAVAALTCKETHGPVLAAFGVIALVQRRPKSWIAAPILVGLAWFVLAVKVIIPSYFPEFPTVYNRFIGVASTEFPAGFFKALIADPGATLGLVFSREHLALVYRIAKPFAFLAVFGPLPLVAALPIGGLIFLLKDPLPVRQVHILAGILPFVFWASLEGARRLSQFAARVTKIAPEKRGRVHGAAAWLLPAVAAVQVAGPGTFGLYQNYGNRPMASMRASNVLDPAFRTPTDAERRALDAVRSIPPDIKVAANARFLLYLSARPEFQEFGIQHTVKDFAGVPLVVLWFPRAECRTCVYARWTPELLSLAAHLVEAGDYGVAAFDPAFAILSSRRYPPQGFEPRADLEEPFRERMNELLEIAEAGSPWPRDLPRPDAPFFR